MKTGLPEWQFTEALRQICDPAFDMEKACQKIAELALRISGGNLAFVYVPFQTANWPLEDPVFWHPLLITLNQPANPSFSNEPAAGSLRLWLKEQPVFPAIHHRTPTNSYPEPLIWFGEHFDTFWAIPLRIDDRVQSVLGVCYRNAYLPAENAQKQLETLAHFGGAAIRHLITAKFSQKRASQLESLFQISQLLVSGGYFEEILTFVAQTVVEMMNIQVCSIILADEERQIFYFKAIACPDKSYHQLINASISNFVCGNSYFSRQPTCIPNLKLEKKFADPELAKKYDLHSMLSVPMTCLQKIIGVFNVYTTKVYSFSEPETHLLQLIANQVASVVHETYLTKEIKKIKRDLLAQKKLQRAKSILMKVHQLSEEEAHRLILRRSMDLRKPILEIADNIINGTLVEPH